MCGMLNTTLGRGHGGRMVLGLSDVELSLVLNFMQAIALAVIAGRQQRQAGTIKETNAIVKNGRKEDS